MNLFAPLKAVNHIIYKLLRHLLVEPHAIILFFYRHTIQIQPLGGRGQVRDLDSLEKSIAFDDLVALVALGLCGLVCGVALDDNLPVTEGVAVFEDGGVGDGAAVVGFCEGGGEIDGGSGVGDGEAVGFEFDLALF